MAAGPASQIVDKAVSRLKFPQAFAVFVALFIFDVIIPDFVPFVDEILLGLAAAIFGMWREKVNTKAAARPGDPGSSSAPGKPPTKNVTPGS